MFIVMRTHTRSHTTKNVLWQVSSRPFDTQESAQNWCEFMQQEYLEENPKGPHKFFVIWTDFPQTLA